MNHVGNKRKKQIGEQVEKDITAFEKELLEKIINTCERDPNIMEVMDGNSQVLGPDSVLGLDSLDAVEIVSLIQADYGVRITSKETSVEVLSSLRSIASYINDNK